MHSELSARKCLPCEGLTAALSRARAEELLRGVTGWELAADAKQVSRQIKAKNFMAAVDLIGKIAAVAEAENHHPDLHLTGYKNLRIELSTHAIKGLSENDFILAAKINKLIGE